MYVVYLGKARLGVNVRKINVCLSLRGIKANSNTCLKKYKKEEREEKKDEIDESAFGSFLPEMNIKLNNYPPEK